MFLGWVFCPGWTQKVSQVGGCRWGKLQDNFGFWSSNTAPNKSGTGNWQVSITVAFSYRHQGDWSKQVAAGRHWCYDMLWWHFCHDSRPSDREGAQTWTSSIRRELLAGSDCTEPCQNRDWAWIFHFLQKKNKVQHRQMWEPCWNMKCTPGTESIIKRETCLVLDLNSASCLSCYWIKKFYAAYDLCLVPNVCFRTSSNRFPK